MKTVLRQRWESRSPGERRWLVVMGAGLVVALYVALVWSATLARGPLHGQVGVLRAQAARLDLQARELDQLRAAPPSTLPDSDLRALVQGRLDGTGLSRGLARLESPDAGHVVVVFTAVGFAEWLQWAEGLQALQVRVESCRVEALSTPGLVSITATLARPAPP